MKVPLTQTLYRQMKADCNGLCDITDELVEEANFMKCVKCPFCNDIVDAILTSTTIACPNCKVEVVR